MQNFVWKVETGWIWFGGTTKDTWTKICGERAAVLSNFSFDSLIDSELVEKL